MSSLLDNKYNGEIVLARIEKQDDQYLAVLEVHQKNYQFASIKSDKASNIEQLIEGLIPYLAYGKSKAKRIAKTLITFGDNRVDEIISYQDGMFIHGDQLTSADLIAKNIVGRLVS